MIQFFSTRTTLKTTIALGFALTTASALFGTDAGADTLCPFGRQDRAFDYTRDAQHCRVGLNEGNPVGARYGRIYNVFCPGRMTVADAVKVGKALGFGSSVFSGNPIPLQYGADWELKPSGPYSESDIKHLAHYTCGSPAGVATHFKVQYSASGATSAKVAKRCKSVNQSGTIAVGSRMDREYKCSMHMYSTERYGDATGPVKVYDVAKLLVSGDAALLTEARSKNARVCLLGYGSEAPTDIQCSPCKTSDKLIVRVKTVRKGWTCPTGTLSYIE
jgi:hypothetical protein